MPTNQLQRPVLPDLVSRIQQNDQVALHDLYQILQLGTRLLLCRHLGPRDLDDKVHDIFLTVVRAIQRGQLRDPERLMGFVQAVVHHQIADYIDDLVLTRSRRTGNEFDPGIVDKWQLNPEQSLACRRNVDLIQSVLNGMREKDREVLSRFYLQEQSSKEICAAMKLSGTMFRLLISRAKIRFGDAGKRKLKQQALASECARSSALGPFLN